MFRKLKENAPTSYEEGLEIALKYSLEKLI